MNKEIMGSDTEKVTKQSLLKSVHTSMMQSKEMVQKSIIDYVEIHKDKVIITLKPECSGIKMHIDEDDYEEASVFALCFGNYEREETEMICKILEHYKNEKEFQVFDIGANVGWYTLNIRKRFPNMSVHSFEPSPITYFRLVSNMELNGYTGKQAYNLGLYKENGKLDFYYDKEGSGASSLVNLREKDTINKITVNMERLDDWAEKTAVKRVDFIKCDVEGSELFVYQGGRKLIEANKPIVFSEMLRKWSAKFNYTPNDIIEFYEEMGYGCFVISNGRLKECKRVDENTVETNYFFMHREKHREMIKELLI